MHPDAPYAAKASIAAQKQDKFWQMHDKLFEASASHQPDALKQDKVDAMGPRTGPGHGAVPGDVNAPDTAQVIRDDQAQAAKARRQRHPALLHQRGAVSGAVPYESFKPVIDAQLKRANAALATGVAKKDLYETLTKDGLSGPPAPPPQAAPQPQARNVEPGSGPFIGSKKPKVTIVEWSDFQCPYCARVEPTLKQILDTYKDDVRLVWRNEPLSFPPERDAGRQGGHGGREQGNDKFWKMHALLFAHQTELSEAKYEEWAKEGRRRRGAVAQGQGVLGDRRPDRQGIIPTGSRWARTGPRHSSSTASSSRGPCRSTRSKVVDRRADQEGRRAPQEGREAGEALPGAGRRERERPRAGRVRRPRRSRERPERIPGSTSRWGAPPAKGPKAAP